MAFQPTSLLLLFYNAFSNAICLFQMFFFLQVYCESKFFCIAAVIVINRTCVFKQTWKKHQNDPCKNNPKKTKKIAKTSPKPLQRIPKGNTSPHRETELGRFRWASTRMWHRSPMALRWTGRPGGATGRVDLFRKDRKERRVEEICFKRPLFSFKRAFVRTHGLLYVLNSLTCDFTIENCYFYTLC